MMGLPCISYIEHEKGSAKVKEKEINDRWKMYFKDKMPSQDKEKQALRTDGY